MYSADIRQDVITVISIHNVTVAVYGCWSTDRNEMSYT